MNICLAAPYSDKIDRATGLIQGEYRAWLEKIIAFLENKGHTVSCAHRLENWGALLRTPEKALEADHAGIRDAALVIAHLGVPWSPGVQMELGFAMSFGKRIIVINERGRDVPYLVKGMSALGRGIIVEFDDPDDLLLALDKLV